ncbi:MULTISPECIES: DUF6684 family protein [Halorussus]|uniref:DUF6684 family protein n=1 Tax=Halorussus TaxID=1070314 RepID=UPI00209F1314|nr:DUF6684 family protein [Halorussus vallis]USZ74316.1 cox cluster protein [Halorussus vallis]
MDSSVFNRETLLDITVNLVPMGILLFFIVLTAVVSPWPDNIFIKAVALGLHVIPFVGLALLTYIAAQYI